ncbi:MAG: hypothetical protein VKJ64_05280 [Leptolyngbyaceae bacterium]|nr:hypothetical protein [Leptolyngbyaceae bacterium]
MGITKLYNAYFNEPASQLYKLHKQLDALVLEAYGFSAEDDLLEKLLALNLELAEKEKYGEAVVGPWAPGAVRGWRFTVAKDYNNILLGISVKLNRNRLSAVPCTTQFNLSPVP